MAKSIKSFITTDLDEDTMATARKQALAKKARMVAEQELGIGDSSAPVIKGPAVIKDEAVYDVTIDVAPYTDRIFLDGKWYMQGRTYKFGQRVADSVREIMARTWEHQAEIDGKDTNMYRRGNPIALSPAA